MGQIETLSHTPLPSPFNPPPPPNPTCPLPTSLDPSPPQLDPIRQLRLTNSHKLLPDTAPTPPTPTHSRLTPPLPPSLAHSNPLLF
ncbi:hypothetical protein Pmani_033356 [Petrolisthes manimaculis]|uniref:Uncharacterized protein n=1 Tax=Petrolisthes manimaculis TaxID=1843537 RepID=A0AAE1TQ58_9EUCA|nr:hypothetical protein Pmani_033356 [Petrolisthes manimaculis]